MKKAIVFVLIFALIGAGILLHKLDKETVEKGEEPKYCLKFINEDKKERMGDSESLRFGVWFLDKKEVKYN